MFNGSFLNSNAFSNTSLLISNASSNASLLNSNAFFNASLLNSSASFNGMNLTKTTPDPVFTATQITTFQLCHGFAGSVGFIENIGVLIVILCNQIMLDFPSNWFILSLAVADAFTCLATILFVFTINTNGVSFLFGHFLAFALLSSAGNLFMLTFNRFLSVYDSLRYPAKMPIRRAKRLVFIPWIIGFLLCAFNVFSYHENIEITQYIQKIYYSALILSITSFNMYMLKKAREKRKETERLRTAVLGRNCKVFMKNDHRLVRLLIVSATFFGSVIPPMLISYSYPTEIARHSPRFQRMITWFALPILLNAITDPLIYTTNHPIFKRYLNRFRNWLLGRNVVIAKVFVIRIKTTENL